MPRKIWLALGAVVIILLLLAGYFLAVPAWHVGVYKQGLAKAHQDTHEPFKKIDDEIRGYTSSRPTTPQEYRQSLDGSQNNLNTAREKINANRQKLNGLNDFLFLDIHPSYKTAKKVKALEQEYLKTYEEFLAEEQACISFLKQYLAMTERLQTATESMGMSASPLTGGSFESFTGIMEVALLEVRALPQVDSLSTVREPLVKIMEEMNTIFNEGAEAEKSGNQLALFGVYLKMIEASERFSDSLGKTKDQKGYPADSKIIIMADKLQNLNREITLETAKL